MGIAVNYSLGHSISKLEAIMWGCTTNVSMD
jgi:hypothetical protein